MNTKSFSRRAFLQRSLTFAAGAPLALELLPRNLLAGQTAAAPLAAARGHAKVAIASCKTYGPEVRAALDHCFDQLGGLGSLVKGKTVAVKLNLTGTDPKPFMD